MIESESYPDSSGLIHNPNDSCAPVKRRLGDSFRRWAGDRRDQAVWHEAFNNLRRFLEEGVPNEEVVLYQPGTIFPAVSYDLGTVLRVEAEATDYERYLRQSKGQIVEDIQTNRQVSDLSGLVIYASLPVIGKRALLFIASAHEIQTCQPSELDCKTLDLSDIEVGTWRHTRSRQNVGSLQQSTMVYQHDEFILFNTVGVLRDRRVKS
jgi:hypothetical protein